MGVAIYPSSASGTYPSIVTGADIQQTGTKSIGSLPDKTNELIMGAL